MDVSLFFFTLIGVATSCHHGEEKMKKLFSIPTQLTNNKGPFEADKGYDINTLLLNKNLFYSLSFQLYY